MTTTMTRIALFGSLYVVLTVLPPFHAISYGPIQVRVSEALTVFPFLFPEITWGLAIGCFFANLAGGLGLWDITLGPIITLSAGLVTTRVTRSWMAPIPPVLFNSFGVSIYLSYIFEVPYWYTVIFIMIGQGIACFGIGYPLLRLVQKKMLRYGNNRK